MKKSALKILLVDDDEDDFLITSDLLKEIKNASIDLQWVKTYKDGLDILLSTGCDLALVDFRLGQENGIELIEELNKHGNLIPVILLTGQGDHETDVKAMKAGAVDYLVKGDFDSSLLERSIRYAIERKKSEAEIKKLNEGLERRVTERTRQLQEINLELEKEVLERKRAEDDAQKERKLIESLMDSTVEGIIGLDVQGNCTFINLAAAKMLGYRPKEVLGQNMHQLVHYQYQDSNPYPSEKCIVCNAFIKGEVTNQIEEVLWRKDGSSFPVLISSSPLRTKNRINGAVVSITDITEKKVNEKKIYNLAYHDPLTSLPNKILLREKLDRAILDAKRNNYYVGVMFLDLDRFKNINDSLGHKIGDTLLKSVAKRLLTCVGQSDTVARQGGDEFILIVPKLKHIEDIEIIASKILDVLSRPFQINDKDIFITPSIGISVYPNDAEDSEVLIKYADVAMYDSKRTGRNTFRYFTPEMDTEAMEKLNTEIGLRKALVNNEFILYFQPKYDLSSHKIVSLEALVRWNHPLLGLVPPDKFIPSAEEMGIIEKVGAHALDQACKEIKAFEARGIEMSIAVNISPKELNENLVKTVHNVLKKNDVDPHLLELEITESDIMHNEYFITQILRGLKDMGIKMAIDDFGTGYSSLARLRELPVDFLKIDKSFIKDFTTNSNSMSIVRAIIGIARSLKLKVIAEGVETEEEARLLKKYRCDLIQGYYISKPLPSDQIIELLTSRQDQKDTYLSRSRFKFFKF